MTCVICGEYFYSFIKLAVKMLSKNLELKIFIFIFQFLGLIIFKYPSHKFKYSKIGLFMLIIKFATFFHLIHETFKVTTEIFKKKMDVLGAVALTLTFSLMVSQILIVILSFILKKKIFILFKCMEKLDLNLQKSQTQIIKHNFLTFKLFLFKVVSMIFVYRTAPIVIIMFLGLHAITDLFSLVVTNLIDKVNGIEYILR